MRGRGAYSRNFIKKKDRKSSNMKERKFTSFLKRNGSDPKVHPNGFIQVPLSGQVRVHFWHHSIPRQKTRTPIHDHVWDMKSYVLKGRMINIIHRFKESEDGQFDVYVSENGNLHQTDQKFKKSNEELELISEGEEYFVEMKSFHESVPVEPSVTVIKKKDKSNKLKPRVAIPEDRSPDNTFDRKDAMSSSEIWELINFLSDSNVYKRFRLLNSKI